jgi:NADPH:quinone reductase-like Zn-dependent oxidoreductase
LKAIGYLRNILRKRENDFWQPFYFTQINEFNEVEIVSLNSRNISKMAKIKTEAIVLVQKGNAQNAFEKRVIELNEPANNEVLIEVESFGLNYADVMARNGLYREAPPMPCVIGYEVVGKVTKVGENASSDWIGKRVVAFCRFGGYSKQVVTKDTAIVEIEEMNAGDALALCTQSVTAYYMAEYLSPVREGDHVLIHAAAGGVGTILIQLAKKRGAIVYAKIGAENKRELVKSLGADFVINYNDSNYEVQIEKLLNGERLDISYNPVAGSTFKKDFKLLGSGGRLVLFGGSEMSGTKWGILSTLNFVRKMGLMIPIGLMMRSKNVLGVNMLKIADNKPKIMTHCLQEVVTLYKQRFIVPQVGGIYPVSEISKAHESLENGKTIGKIIINW